MKQSLVYLVPIYLFNGDSICRKGVYVYGRRIASLAVAQLFARAILLEQGPVFEQGLFGRGILNLQGAFLSLGHIY